MSDFLGTPHAQLLPKAPTCWILYFDRKNPAKWLEFFFDGIKIQTNLLEFEFVFKKRNKYDQYLQFAFIYFSKKEEVQKIDLNFVFWQVKSIFFDRKNPANRFEFLLRCAMPKKSDIF